MIDNKMPPSRLGGERRGDGGEILTNSIDSREKKVKNFSDKKRSIDNINSSKLKDILIEIIAQEKRIDPQELEIKINSIDEAFIEIEIIEPFHQYKGIKTETLFSKLEVKE